MDSYKFGGSKLKRFNASVLMKISASLCAIKKMYILIARKINKISICIKKLSIRLSKESDPMTVHITRIIPLDKWYIRVEFIVDRFDKRCVHLYSESGSYNDFLMAYKKGDEVSMPIDNILIAIAGMEGSWKKFN